jgi:hypothetical protein
MPATTLAQDSAALTRMRNQFGTKSPTGARGTLNFAGNYWPTPRSKHTLIYHDVEFAIREARSMIVKGYLVASSALQGNTKAVEQMTKWFGPAPTHQTAANQRWWDGARIIIGAVEDFILKNVNVYYRGNDNLKGQPCDYPGVNRNLVAYDMKGFAESFAGGKNNIIGLCKLFFRKQRHASTMNLRGNDSVGGTLVHELSHNICSTQDHQKHDDSGTCYGVTGCIDLANNKPSRAWYNADNVEYFCEDVYYGISTTGARPIQTGAAQSVAQLRQRFGG